jgi:sec-independent protein translocase protein TatB
MTLDPSKLIIVAIVALIVLGPDKLPVMMRQAGKYWNTFKSIRETVQGEVNSAMSTIADSTGLARTSATETVTQVRNSLETLKAQISSSTSFVNPFAVGASTNGEPVPIDQTTRSTSFGPQGSSQDSSTERFTRPQVSKNLSGGYPYFKDVGREAYRPGCPELN